MQKRKIIKFVLFTFILSLFFALGNLHYSKATGVGSIDTECQAKGFDYGVAKWQWNGTSYQPDGSSNGTNVTGTSKLANWTSIQKIDGVIRKVGTSSTVFSGGFSGSISSSQDISHLTFCKNNTPLFCELTLTKTDFEVTTEPGGNLTYQVKLKNTGTANCTGGGVKLRDYFDVQTNYVSANIAPNEINSTYIEWNFGTIAPGVEKIVNLNFNVKPDVACDYIINNKVKYWSDQTSWGSFVIETTPISCQPQPYCGDGIVNGNEECDGEAGVGQYQTCSNQCLLIDLTYCGDNIKQTPNDVGLGGPQNDGYEECDGIDGVGDNQACTEQCTLINLEYCGDGIKNGEEECDGTDGVGNHQYCTEQCTLVTMPYCGDGNLDQNEQCDDGNNQNNDGCNESCELEFGQINGCKYKDLNNNGLIDTDEPKLSSWPILLYDPVVSTENPIQNTTTNSDGCYEFTDLTFNKQYLVTEDSVPGWEQTYPNNNQGYQIDIQSTIPYINKDFANYQIPINTFSTISGCKYNDLNNNGTIDSEEPTLVGWTIKLQSKNSDQPLIAVTGDDGCYAFTQISLGEYELSENQQNNWTQTYPASGTYDLNITTSGDYGNWNFANHQIEGNEEPFCGNNIKETGEECDGTDGVPVNYSCSAQCQLVCISNCGGGGGGPTNPLIEINKSTLQSFTNPGGIVDYTITIKNIGNSTGLNLKVTDILPAGLSYYATTTNGIWNLGNIAINETKTITYQVLYADNISVGNYTNTAKAEITNGNTVTDTATVEVRVPTVFSQEYEPILTITKTVNMAFSNPGGEVTYTVTVTNTNTGNLTAENVNLLDRLPKEFYFNENNANVNSWSLGNLQPGESKIITYNVTVKPGTKTGIYENIAVASADNTPEVSAKTPLEIREVTALGLSLPDTNGSLTTKLLMIFGSLSLAAAYLVYLLKREYSLV